jgi:hypothetical protein
MGRDEGDERQKRKDPSIHGAWNGNKTRPAYGTSAVKKEVVELVYH